MKLLHGTIASSSHVVQFCTRIPAEGLETCSQHVKNRELYLVLHFECFLEALLDMSYVHITAVFTYIFAECIRT